MNRKEDIYRDLCGDYPPEKGIQGGWTGGIWVGSCNACYHGDNRSGPGETVFRFQARNLEMRLCAGHLRELVKISRYK